MIAEISSHREELRELCRRFHVRRLDLFGSATGDDFDPARSDLDFLVEFDPRAPEALSFKTFFGLKEAPRRCSAVASTLSSRARFAIPISRRASSGLASPSLKRDRKSLLWDASNAATALGGMTAGTSFREFRQRSCSALRRGAPVRDSRRSAQSTRPPGCGACG
jgi:predicted nucleotidyltransferase